MTSSLAAFGRIKAPSVAGASGLLALLLLLGAAYASSHPGVLGALWTCSFKGVTGLPCLTCGLTRVLLHLAEGEPLAALALAPLPTLAIVLSLLAGLWHLVARARAAPSPDEVLGRLLRGRPARLAVLVVVALLWGYAIVRSLLVGAP